MFEAKKNPVKQNVTILTLRIAFRDIGKYDFFMIPEETKELEESKAVFNEYSPMRGTLKLEGLLLEDVSKAVHNFKLNKPLDALFNFAIVVNPGDTSTSKFMFWDGENTETHDPSSFIYSVDPLNDSVLKDVSKEDFNVLSLNKNEAWAQVELSELFAKSSTVKSAKKSVEDACNGDTGVLNAANVKDIPPESADKIRNGSLSMSAVGSNLTKMNLANKSLDKKLPSKRYIAIFTLTSLADEVLKNKLGSTLFQFSLYRPTTSLKLSIPASNGFNMTINEVNCQEIVLETSLYNLLNTMFERSNCFKVVIGEISHHGVVLNTWKTTSIDEFKAVFKDNYMSGGNNLTAEIEFKSVMSTNVETDRKVVEDLIQTAGFKDGDTCFFQP